MRTNVEIELNFIRTNQYFFLYIYFLYTHTLTPFNKPHSFFEISTSFVNVYEFTSVSYTHLDVYKRQLLLGIPACLFPVG